RRSPFTCPECGGTLWEFSETGFPRFRCHVGHAYSMRSLVADQSQRVEATLWAALRNLHESEKLARRLAEQAEQRGNMQSAIYHREAAEGHHAHTDVLRDILARAVPEQHASEQQEAPEQQEPKRKKRVSGKD